MTKSSAFFRALGDPTRLRIVHLLSRRSLCVCDKALRARGDCREEPRLPRHAAADPAA